MKISELIESLQEFLNRGFDAEVRIETDDGRIYEIAELTIQGIILAEYYDDIEDDED